MLDELKSKWILLLTSYAFAIGVLHEWGYWGRFNINILKFMMLTDVIRSFAYPFVTSVVFFLVGALIASGGAEVLPKGGGRNTRVGNYLKRWIRPLLAFYLAAVFVGWWLGGELRWIIALGMLVPVFTAMVSRYRLLHRLIENNDLRRSVSFIGVGMPLMAFAYGATQGEAVLSGSRYDEARLPDEVATVRYIGHAGDYVFFLRAENKTVILRSAASTLPLQLTRMTNSTPK